MQKRIVQENDQEVGPYFGEASVDQKPISGSAFRRGAGPFLPGDSTLNAIAALYLKPFGRSSLRRTKPRRKIGFEAKESRARYGKKGRVHWAARA